MQLAAESQSGSWQETCTLELLRCAGLEANASGAGSIEWKKVKSNLSSQKRIVLADADLTKSSLREFDFSQCYITRINFTHSNLSGAKFVQAILKSCNFSSARLQGADVLLAHFQNCKLNIANSVSDIKGVRPWLSEMISNQQYIADHDGNTRTLARQIWDILTDHGNSLWRLLGVSFLAIFLFGSLFYLGQQFLGLVITADHLSFLKAVEFSAENFLNAGPSFNPKSDLVAGVVILNITFGIGVLGVFIAILSRKLIVFVK